MLCAGSEEEGAQGPADLGPGLPTQGHLGEAGSEQVIQSFTTTLGHCPWTLSEISKLVLRVVFATLLLSL